MAREPWFRSIMGRSERNVIVEERRATPFAAALTLHAFDKAGDRRLEQLVDLGSGSVKESLHQAEIRERLGEGLAGILQCLSLASRLVDHAVILPGVR